MLEKYILFSRHASPLQVYVLWRSTIEVKMFSPTRYVVDATENSKEGGVAAEVCNSQTGVLFCTLLRDIYARIRTTYTTKYIQPKKKKETPL